MESLVSTMSISENNDGGSSAFGSQLTVTNGSSGGHIGGSVIPNSHTNTNGHTNTIGINGHAVKISLSEGQMITNSIPASITTATLQPHHTTKNHDPIV